MNIELNVARYKDFSKGPADDYTEAIEKALDDLPKSGMVKLCGTSSELHHAGCILRFATIETDYRITHPIALPADRSVALVGTGPFGVTIRLDMTAASQHWGTMGAYAFYVPADASAARPSHGRRCVLFERLTLVGGGIAFGPDSTGWNSVRGCVFLEAAEWAVSGEGGSNLEIEACTVAHCQAGIRLDGADVVIRRVRRTRFIDSVGPDLRIGRGARITACSFEGKGEASTSQPFILVTGPGGDVRIRDCSFGDATGAPQTLVSIGAMPSEALVQQPVRDVQLVGCQFWIREPAGLGVGPAGPPCAVRLRAPTIGLQIRECNAWSGRLVVAEDYYGFAADQLGWGASYAQQWPLIVAGCGHIYDGVVSNLAVFPPAIPELFSHGGRGFEVVGDTGTRAAGRGSDPFRGTRNLLREPGAHVAPSKPVWSSFGNVDLLQSAEDPESPLGYRFAAQRTGAGPARVEQEVSWTDLAAVVDEAIVFSCWIRRPADVANLTDVKGCRLEITLNSLPIGGSASRVIRLSTGWERHYVVAWMIPPLAEVVEPVLKVAIHHGESDDDAQGTLFFCGAQLERGDRPTPIIASPGLGVLHTEHAAQALSVGPLLVGELAGALPEANGFNVGDALLNVKPKATGTDYDGWVCVEIQEPGAWKTKVWKAFGPFSEG